MKKLLYLLLLCTISVFAEKPPVLVSGPCTLTVGQQATYSVSSILGQCAECYDWDINNTDLTTSGNVSIVGSDRNNTVTIQALSAGTFTLKVTFFNETGCNVLELLCTPTIYSTDCDFTLTTNSSYTNNTTTLLCTATTTPNLTTGVTYNWTATFQNGTTQSQTTTTNQASFNFTPSNGIISYTVAAIYDGCLKQATKSLPCSIGTLSYTQQKTVFQVFNFTATATGATTIYWTFTYGDGHVINYTGNPAPSIPLCHNTSTLLTVTFVASSKTCSKTYTRTDNLGPCGSRIASRNPISDKLDLFIEEDFKENFSGKIFDMNGLELAQFNRSNYVNIDLSHLTKAIYLIKIYDDQGNEIMSEKLVKE